LFLFVHLLIFGCTRKHLATVDNYLIKSNIDESIKSCAKLYSEQIRYKRYRYTEVTVDSLMSDKYYVISFFSSNNQFFLFKDSANLKNRTFPNQMTMSNNHHFLWNDGNILSYNPIVISFLKSESLLNEFYLNLQSNQVLDDSNIPVMKIGERKKMYYYLICRENPNQIFYIGTKLDGFRIGFCD